MNHSSIINQLRGPKLYNMSVFDWVATFIAAVLLGYWRLDNFTLVNIMKIFIILICTAVIVHYVCDVPTMFNYYLGLNSYADVIATRHN